jgi:hypothetical protein
MIHQFNHRFGDYRDKPEGSENTSLPDIPPKRLADPNYSVFPRYWIAQGEVEDALRGKWDRGWLLGWRDITNTTNERTVIADLVPRVAAGHKFVLAFPATRPELTAAFCANLNSLVLDFAARQKLGGTSLTYFIMKQLPLLPPAIYRSKAQWLGAATPSCWIAARIIELFFVASDLTSFARDVGYDGPPFRWDDERRFIIRCELDAAFFHLYAISRDDADYIMETFPIVKRKDDTRYGEYRTKRVILEIYDEMEQAKRTGKPYPNRLDPPPGDPRAAHREVGPSKRDSVDVL